jgi:hypothetical protein
LAILYLFQISVIFLYLFIYLSLRALLLKIKEVSPDSNLSDARKSCPSSEIRKSRQSKTRFENSLADPDAVQIVESRTSQVDLMQSQRMIGYAMTKIK